MEVRDSCTVGNVVVHRIHHFSLDNGGECGHLSVRVGMPDHTLDKSLSRRSARIEVDLSGRGLELHGVFP